MALKALMLRKKIDLKQKELEALRGKTEEFDTRSSELEAAINEVTEGDAEAQAVIDGEIEAYEAERAAHDQAIADLEKEIGELENDLAAEELRQDTTPAEPKKSEEERKEEKIDMIERNKFGITREMMTREDVKEFIGTLSACIKEKRALSNAGLLIPEVFLGIVRENVINYSKLYRHTYLRRLNGEGKLTIMGTIPEAVWTACCANINEIDLGFADAVVDCNKVAAFVPVCNTIVEDSEIDIAAQLVEALSIAIGKALDKAILYGTGSGMPLGVYTRLAQESQPASYPATARTWVDLHSTNILTIANTVTGTGLFQTIMLDSAVMSGKYSRGEIVWCMNELTYKFLKAQGMTVNAAGAIVSAVDGQMPGVGGIVEVLDFVPNYNIVGGYFDCYLLAERSGVNIESAPLTKFVEDETLFRAKARYDGLPVIAEAFIALAINGAAAAGASMAADAANTPAFIQINKSAFTLATTTGTVQLRAKVLNANGQKVDAAITWASSATAKAIVSDSGLVTGKTSGSTVITATAGDAVAVCNVTVPS